MVDSTEDLQATFCSTLVDEWARHGVVHAVVCPGSRSTPLALALWAEGRITVHVHHDERSGGFMALGLGAATGEPTVVLTTSGTAAVELHPAVMEAHLAGVPLLVCTADRPPELIGVGAPQAIDQTHLYGRSVRWFHAPGVADAAAMGGWRALAARAYAEATGGAPGPVHLNLAFREPLIGTPGDLPPARPGGGPWAWRPVAGVPRVPAVGLTEDLAGRRGVIVAGPGSGSGAAVARVATILGWPVLASPVAAVWSEPGAPVVPAPDALLRASLADLAPEVIVRLGGPMASRVVGEWLAASGAAEVVAAGALRWADPHGTASVVLPLTAEDLLDAWLLEVANITPTDGGAWARRWHEHGEVAAAALQAALAAEIGPTEPGIARALVDALPTGAALVASSSMPIRDLEFYVRPAVALEGYANRGANGIDGVVSTAVGIALAAPTRPTALLIGDIAFIHDSNGLLGASERGLNLVMVVVDNDGGGIFSFLPPADALATDQFEALYGTPHGLNLVALAQAYGVEARRVDDLGPAVLDALRRGGVQVLLVRTDRLANVAVHRRLNDAVVLAVEALSRA